MTLAVLLVSTQALAQGVVFATSEDISAFDRMVGQSKENTRLRAERAQTQEAKKQSPKSKQEGRRGPGLRDQKRPRDRKGPNRNNRPLPEKGRRPGR